MAKNLLTEYPGKVGGATPQYPYGEPRDVITNGDGTGTPWQAELIKDLQGFLQALLVGGGITPSNTADNAINSQYLEAITKLKAPSVFTTSTFINDKFGYSTGDTVQTTGYLTDGDGGDALWVNTGNSGTPSQEPTALGTAHFTDASGDEWALVETTGVKVKSLGAVGDGVTNDTVAIQIAIDYLEGSPCSKVLLGANSYLVDNLIVDSDGTFIVGEGSGFLLGGIAQIRASAKTRLISTAGGYCVTFTSKSGEAPKVSGGMGGVMLDVRGQSNGLALLSWRQGYFKDIFVYAPLDTGIFTGAYSGTLSSEPYDTQHNVFMNCHVDDKNITTSGMNALKMTGGQGDGGVNGGNSSFNYFYSCRLYSATGEATVLENTDNNFFYGLRTGGNGALYSLVLSDQDTGVTTGTARYNQFHGGEFGGLGVLAKASQSGGNSSFDNKIYGWNSSNGADTPVIEAPSGGSNYPTLEVFGESTIRGVSVDFEDINIRDDNTPIAPSVQDSATIGSFSEGTFTPLVVGTTDAGTANYSAQSGRYTRVGNMVTIELYINYNTHTGTGNLEVHGLPYTQAAGNFAPVFTVATQQINYSDTLVCYGLANSETLRLRQMTSGATSNLPIDVAGIIFISGSYHVD